VILYLPGSLVSTIDAETGIFLEMICLSTAVGLGVLSLLSPWPGNAGAWYRYFASLLLALAAVAVAVSISLAGMPDEIIFLAIPSATVTAQITGLALAGALCRRRFSTLRYLAWFAVSVFAFDLLVFLPLATITLGGPPDLLTGLAATSFYAGIGIVLTLPFLILFRLNAGWKERIEKTLRGR
jgi:hypothetical protein